MKPYLRRTLVLFVNPQLSTVKSCYEKGTINRAWQQAMLY